MSAIDVIFSDDERLLILTLLIKSLTEIGGDPEMTIQQAELSGIIRKMQGPTRTLISRTSDLYRDDAYPERKCDFCGRPYRGPAVYCSLICACDDA